MADDEASNPRSGGRYRTQVAEVINRNQIVSLALEAGYNAFLPVFDGGIDFILYHESNDIVRKVQLKGRWTIDRKYIGRDIWIAFPLAGEWYLLDHDTQMIPIGDAMGYTKTASWLQTGIYNVPTPSRALIEACRAGRFGPPVGPVEGNDAPTRG